jgi:hypothetical protein
VAAAVVVLVAVPGCSGDDGGEGSATALCGLLGPTSGFAELGENFDPTDNARALETLGSMRVELDRLREAAPHELRDAIDTEADYVEQLTAALQAIDPDDAAAAAEAVNGLADEATKANLAAGELQRFEAANCGAATTVTTPTG